MVTTQDDKTLSNHHRRSLEGLVKSFGIVNKLADGAYTDALVEDIGTFSLAYARLPGAGFNVFPRVEDKRDGTWTIFVRPEAKKTDSEDSPSNPAITVAFKTHRSAYFDSGESIDYLFMSNPTTATNPSLLFEQTSHNLTALEASGVANRYTKLLTVPTAVAVASASLYGLNKLVNFALGVNAWDMPAPTNYMIEYAELFCAGLLGAGAAYIQDGIAKIVKATTAKKKMDSPLNFLYGNDAARELNALCVKNK